MPRSAFLEGAREAGGTKTYSGAIVKQKKSKNGDGKIRVAEIHLWRIAKLDRAEKRDPDEALPELAPETQEPHF